MPVLSEQWNLGIASEEEVPPPFDPQKEGSNWLPWKLKMALQERCHHGCHPPKN